MDPVSLKIALNLVLETTRLAPEVYTVIRRAVKGDKVTEAEAQTAKDAAQQATDAWKGES